MTIVASLSDLRRYVWPVITAAALTAGVVLARHLTTQLAAARALAYTDELTRIGNRRAAMIALGRGPLGAIAVCDLDDFKAVNDTHGHAVGDALLSIVARRLHVGLREAGVVMRLGGDEFLLIWRRRPHDLHTSARRLLDLVTAPVAIAGIMLTPSASIGAAYAPPTATGSRLLAAADHAMYQAKQAADHVVIATGEARGRRRVA